MNFQRALDALRVVGVNPCACLRVDGYQTCMQSGPTVAARLLFNGRTYVRISRWQWAQAMLQSIEIQRCATDQQRQTAGGVNSLDLGARITTEISRGIGLGWIANVNQAMRSDSQGRRVRLGGTNIQPTIDHGRI